MRRSLRLVLVLGILCVSAVPLWAQAPTSRETLNLQGRLTDNTGACLTGPYAFQIDIFNVSSGGASLYTDTQGAVQVTNGIYDITIGAGTGGAVPTTVFSGCPDLWIEITVSGETLSPRTHLTAVAYAYCANLLDGMDSTAFATASTAAILDGNSPGALLTLGTNDANALAFETGGTERMRILSTGNVGIGTSTPTSPLHVVGTAGPVAEFDAYGSAPIVKMRHANGTVGAPTAMLLNDNLGTFSMSGYGATGFGNPGKASLSGKAAENWTDAAQGAYLTLSTTPIGSTTSAERLRITDAGNVGIGTTTPTSALHVVGTSGAVVEFDTYGASPIVKMRRANGTTATPTAVLLNENLGTFSMSGYGTTGFGNPGKASLKGIAAENWTDAAMGAHLALSTTPIGTTTSAERLRITDAGLVGIGTTTPTSALHVVGTSGAVVEFDTYGASPIVKMRRANGTTGTPTGVLLNENLGTFSMSGYGATGFGNPGKASLKGIAAENWTDAAMGAHIALSTTPVGSTTSAERMRITDMGYVGIGTTTPGEIFDVVSEDSNTSHLRVTEYATAGPPASFHIRRAGGTEASPVLLAANASIAGIRAWGFDGAVFQTAAGLSLTVDGTPAAGDMPGKITFQTTPAGSFSLVERMRIDNVGNTGIGINAPTSRLHVKGSGNTSATSGLNVINSTSASALFVRDDGNVGIGTVAPGQRLDVSGNANITGNLTVTGSISGSNSFVQDGNSFAAPASLGTNDAQSLTLETTNAPRITILSSGEVGIGTVAPTQMLEVNGNVLVGADLTVPGGSGANLFVIDNDSAAADTVNISNDGAGIGDTISIGSDSDVIAIDTGGAGTNIQVSNDGAATADTIGIGSGTDSIYIDTGGAGTTISISDDGAGDTINLGSPADVLSIAATIANPNALIFDGATAGGGTTTFTITDPNAARTVTVPNNSGKMIVGSSGTFTWNTGTPSFAVADVNVTASSQVLVFPTNAPGSALVGSSKSPYLFSITPGTSFTLNTNDNTNAAGTETFNYIIINP